MMRSTRNFGTIIKQLFDEPSLRQKAKEVSDYVRKLPDEVLSLPENLRQTRLKIVNLMN